MYPYPESMLDAKALASKRVSRACDRCRLKKTKCDGRRCCNRCLADDAICVFSKRKRSSDRPYSSEYVQLLEDQQMKLVEGVQELYRRLRRGEGWTGPKIAEDSQGYPLVQDVLDSLAVLAPSERKVPKRLVDDASSEEQDEDEEASIDCDVSVHLTSASPPLTPSGSSQSSTTTSPVEDCPKDGLAVAYLPTGYSQLISKPRPEDRSICSSFPLLQGQQMLTDTPQYWSVTSSFGSAGGTSDFGGLMDPYGEPQPTNGWYPGNYMMM